MWLPSHGSDAGDKHSYACVGVGVGERGGRVGERGDDYRLYTHAQVTCAEISPFLPGRHWSVEGGGVESVSLFALECPLGEVEAKGRHSEREREGGREGRREGERTEFGH